MKSKIEIMENQEKQERYDKIVNNHERKGIDKLLDEIFDFGTYSLDQQTHDNNHRKTRLQAEREGVGHIL